MLSASSLPLLKLCIGLLKEKSLTTVLLKSLVWETQLSYKSRSLQIHPQLACASLILVLI